MASFSVVKTFPADSPDFYEIPVYWKPKQALTATADQYAALAARPDNSQ